MNREQLKQLVHQGSVTMDDWAGSVLLRTAAMPPPWSWVAVLGYGLAAFILGKVL